MSARKRRRIIGWLLTLTVVSGVVGGTAGAASASEVVAHVFSHIEWG